MLKNLVNRFLNRYTSHPEAVIISCFYNPTKSAYRRAALRDSSESATVENNNGNNNNDNGVYEAPAYPVDSLPADVNTREVILENPETSSQDAQDCGNFS